MREDNETMCCAGRALTGTRRARTAALSAAALFAAALALPGGEAWGAQCTVIDRHGAGTTADPYRDGQVICGDNASATPDFAVAIGESATAGGISAIAIGKDAQATAESGTAIGVGAKSEGKGSTAIGTGAHAEKDGSIAIGDTFTGTNAYTGRTLSNQKTHAQGLRSFAMGDGAQAKGDDSYAMGTAALAEGKGAIAIGPWAEATKDGAIAFGRDARATKAGAVAVGDKSVANRAAGEDASGQIRSGYDILTNRPSTRTDPVWRSTTASYSVGDVSRGVTRQITDVAAGAEDTDAVNVAQLKRVQEAIDNHHFFVSANGKTSPVYGDDTVFFVGDDNIFVDLNGHTISIHLNPDLTVDSVSINNGGPVMNRGGIDMANTPITNLADGKNPHDAVNKGQLDGVDDRLRAGIAGAVAQANIPQVMTPGKAMLGVGLGHFRNQTALGLGWSARSDNGRWVLRNSVGLHDDATSVGGGIGYEF